ncbi:MAG: metallophosphoesterase family protein [Lachnospiraceae bacterium]|nr:metallophosphoesterase family protein [Lachnospiraceae bacterium]MBQ9563739.1 metallophosphoesterase family protein [Lachnospiraceae bacterium]MBR0153574.1 metallophosphoesterase family protein [Lachnospiraceae bacterium]
MKLLLLSDVEDAYLYDFYSPDKLKDVDVMISCGDLKANYLEFLVTVSNKPLLYVNGNHDSAFKKNPPGGCDSLEDRVLTVKGLRVAGLGGSMRYNSEGIYMYNEKQMEKRVRKLKKEIRKAGGIDILVTHAPMRGWGDQDGLAHRGFECFREILDEFHPQLMAFGHVHREYGGFKREYIYSDETRLINACGHYYMDLEPGETVPAPKSGLLGFLRRK